jgi:hypothetical protein
MSLSDAGSAAKATELARRAAPQTIARKTRFMKFPSISKKNRLASVILADVNHLHFLSLCPCPSYVSSITVSGETI